MFKKFFQFISEGKKPKPHEIQQADPQSPPVDPSIVTKCPKCGSELKTLFYPPGIHFNGSGFYKTSNKDKKNYD